MKVEKMNCGDGIEFSVLRTDKFKNDILVVNFLMPKTEKNIAVGNLLSKMFLRGTEKHSTNLGINRVLAGLYDASVSVAHIALPDAMCFRLSCNFVDDRFIPDGDRTSVLSGVISMNYLNLYIINRKEQKQDLHEQLSMFESYLQHLSFSVILLIQNIPFKTRSIYLRRP